MTDDKNILFIFIHMNKLQNKYPIKSTNLFA